MSCVSRSSLRESWWGNQIILFWLLINSLFFQCWLFYRIACLVRKLLGVLIFLCMLSEQESQCIWTYNETIYIFHAWQMLSSKTYLQIIYTSVLLFSWKIYIIASTDQLSRFKSIWGVFFPCYTSILNGVFRLLVLLWPFSAAWYWLDCTWLDSTLYQ